MVNITNNWIQDNISLFIDKKVVIITGAGISVPCGIPDFRSKTGIFREIRDKYKIKGEDLFTFKFSIDSRTRDIYLEYIHNLKELVDMSIPSFTHHFFKWYSSISRVRVYTQNIDGLEEKAGVKDLVYLHGNLKYLKCLYCGDLTPFIIEKQPHDKSSINSESIMYEESVIEDESCISSGSNINNDTINENESIGNSSFLDSTSIKESCVDEGHKKLSNMTCKKCAQASSERLRNIPRYLHTNIIHYHQEHPDSDFISKCIREDSDCNLLIVVGTSLNVFGVKNMVKYFSKISKKCIFVNLEDCKSDMKKYFTHFYKGTSDNFFKQVRGGIEDYDLDLSIQEINMSDLIKSNTKESNVKEKIHPTKRNIFKKMKRLSLTKEDIINNFLLLDNE